MLARSALLPRPIMAPKVFSYIRWSSAEQAAGNSLQRQMDYAARVATERQMELDTSHRDSGVSAFRGRNAVAGDKGGALGRFLDLARSGDVEPGSILVLEALDRLSRQAPARALNLLQSIVYQGISVITAADGKEYTEENIDRDPYGTLFMSLMKFITANEESEKKADRSRDNWQRKKARARNGGALVTTHGPSWLRYNPEVRDWDVIEERAEVVRRIFAMAAQGLGAPTITRTLNEEGVKPFGRTKDGKTVNGLVPQWHPIVVSALLRSPSVIGTYTPTSISYTDAGKRRRTPEEPIPNVWPVIVDADTYATVMATRMDSSPSLRGRHAGGELQNLFGGLLRCAHCGGAIYRNSKGNRRPGAAPVVYLQCLKVKTGAGCAVRSMRYEEVEMLFLHNVGFTLSQVAIGDTTGELEHRLQTIMYTDDAIQDSMATLREMMRKDRSQTLRQQLVEMARERDALEAERLALLDRIEATAGRLVSQRLSELSDVLEAQPLDRARANVLLRQLTSRVVLDTTEGVLALEWKQGGSTQFSVRSPFKDETRSH